MITYLIAYLVYVLAWKWTRSNLTERVYHKRAVFVVGSKGVYCQQATFEWEMKIDL